MAPATARGADGSRAGSGRRHTYTHTPATERPNRLAFTYVDGRAVHPQTFEAWFTRSSDAAGVPPIGPHGMRHSHATILLANGAELLYVSRRLGHSTVAITGDLYGHTVPATARRIAASFAEILDSAGGRRAAQGLSAEGPKG